MTGIDVDCFGLTHVGRVRGNNEDQFLVATLEKQMRIEHSSVELEPLSGGSFGGRARLLMVADGVGGRAGGELASRVAVRGLSEYAAQAAGCFQRFNVSQEADFLSGLEQGIRRTHELLIERYGSRAPATTLTMAVLAWPRTYIIHVGDSRAYRLCGRTKAFQQVTRDQTLGEYLVDAGVWSEAQATRAQTGGALASAIGGSELRPTINVVDHEPGDAQVLCTDGLTKHVGDEEIGQIVGAAISAESASRQQV
ncbi:MAG: PP2C family serine/threonine-protein phosphatase, partial [Gemmatimonadales bacterium]